MSQRSLEGLGGYPKATALLPLVVADMRLAQEDPLCRQRIALADGIIAILTSTIERLRAEPRSHHDRFVREEVADDGQ